ncbi:MAG: ATP-binding protein [Caulobacter sp.]|nr:ATP-binding protein [Caulobacter sp.]
MTGLALKSRRKLRLVLALGLLVLAIVAAGGLGAMALSARAVDRATALQEQELLLRTLDRQMERLVVDVTSATVWDDAYARTVTRFDPIWTDENFGRYYSQYLHHDRTLILGPDDRLLSASDHGKATPSADLAVFAADLSPLLARVRQSEARAAAGQGLPYGLDATATQSGMIRSQGRIWMVALSQIRPETAAVARIRGPGVVVISARRIGPAFLTSLEDDLGVADIHLMAPGVAPAGIAVPVMGLDDQVLGRLAWTPRQPGRGALANAAGPMILIMAVFLIAGWALALRVSSALKSLGVNDARLEAALEDLTRARDRAEAASAAKTLFLANVSHEIRTPLNGVLGMAQIMDMGELPAPQRNNLAIIREAGGTLLAVLNDVLDLAKIEAGKLEVNRYEIDLAATVSAACAMHMVRAHEKGVRLGVAIEPSATGAWTLDGLRLSQVLGNLVSNAVKFTARGQVSVRVWHSERGLEFAVVDTGIGIAADRMTDLFSKFSQLESGTARRLGGTGLGLAICRDLVTLMGGQIAVESTVGEGSYFSFFLPVERAPVRIAA